MKTKNKFRLPSVAALSALVRAIKPQIADDYRASDDSEDNTPAIELTVGANKEGSWNYQTGDNSFTGGAYSFPVWAVVTVTRRCDSREVAREIRDQLAEGLHAEIEAENYQAERAERTAMRSAGLA